jgi:molybdenum cofactor biosynthesis protein A
MSESCCSNPSRCGQRATVESAGGLESDLPIYERPTLPQDDDRVAAPRPKTAGDTIQDRFGRVFDYLRIAVTDRCNLRCVYCMPEAGVDFARHDALLQTDEILRVIRVASKLGVTKVRYTGGEPLVRSDILELIEGAVGIAGIRTVHLTTNGVLLPGFADRLKRAGLHGINISLDTLDPERFSQCTRRTGVEQVLAGLAEVLALGFASVKVNVVAMRGFNDDEIGAFVELTRKAPITVRFIELMPFDSSQIWRTGRFLSMERMLAAFAQLYPQTEVVNGSSTEHMTFRLPGCAGSVAFIPSYTRDFCKDCTRIRLTADGRIRNCLYSDEEYGLLDCLRHGGTDEDIAQTMKGAMWAKPEDGRAAQQSSSGQGTDGRVRGSMAQIGG